MVIATGASYKSFIKEEENRCFSIEERKKNLLAFSEKVKQARSILVVGAGVVGIELLGELVHTHPEKKLGICLRGNRMLPLYA